MKRCMYCGQENDDSADTCVKCGNPLLDVPANDSEPIEEIPDIDLEETSVSGAENECADRMETQAPGTNADTASMQNGDSDTTPDNEQEAFAPSPEVQEDGQMVPEETGDAVGEAEGQQPYYDQQPYYGPANQQPYRGYDQEVAYDQQSAYNQQPGYYEEEAEEEISPIGQTFPVILRKSRKRVKSALFFLAAFFYSVMTVAAIANIVDFIRNSFIRNSIGRNAVQGGFIDSIETAIHTIVLTIGNAQASDFEKIVFNYIEDMDPLTALAVQAVFILPVIFIMIGLWLAFSSTKVRSREVSTGGFTLIQTMEIIRFIIACLALVAAVTVTVSYVVVAARQSTLTTLIVGIIVLLVVVLLAVMTIMFYMQLLFSIKLVKRNVRSGEYIGRIPVYLLVIGFILCLLTAAATVLLTAPDDYLGLAFSGAHAVWYLLIVLWGLVYRATVKVKIEE